MGLVIPETVGTSVCDQSRGGYGCGRSDSMQSRCWGAGGVRCSRCGVG